MSSARLATGSRRQRHLSSRGVARATDVVVVDGEPYVVHRIVAGVESLEREPGGVQGNVGLPLELKARLLSLHDPHNVPIGGLVVLDGGGVDPPRERVAVHLPSKPEDGVLRWRVRHRLGTLAPVSVEVPRATAANCPACDSGSKGSETVRRRFTPSATTQSRQPGHTQEPIVLHP